MAKQHAQGLIADMMRRRWMKMRFLRIVHTWHGETESGSENGRGREELLVRVRFFSTTISNYRY